MPNHVTNRLHIDCETPERLDEVLEFLRIKEGEKKFEKGTIDFHNITPTPPWVYQDNLTFEMEEKYGRENTWYGWNIDNWGTKWNAYNQPHPLTTSDTIYFDTAWNGVPNLMRKLSLIFKDVTFHYAWADEDTGCNVGKVSLQDGSVLNKDMPRNCSKEAYDLCFEIHRCTPEEMHYKWNAQQECYEYVDEDEDDE